MLVIILIMYIIFIGDRSREAKSDLFLIWLNTTLNDSNIVSEIDQIQDELRSTVDKNLLLFDDNEQCEAYIRSQPLVKNIVLLVNDTTAEWMLKRVPYFSQVICTYVVQTSSYGQKTLKQNHLTKVCGLNSKY